MKKQVRTFGGRQKGQSLVEFALTAPILVLLLVGMVELGNGLNSYLTVLSAGRDAARIAAKGTAQDDALLSLISQETDRLPTDVPTSSQVCTNNPGVCITRTTISSTEKRINVKVCYDHPVIIGIPVLLPGPIRMCSETTMRIAF